jgi:thiamine biosynthesis lipoprotein
MPFDNVPAIETLAPDCGAYSFRDEAVLGTRLHLLFVASSYFAAQQAALTVRREIDRLDSIFSSYRDDSELSALNRARAFVASGELFEVVSRAERWREASAGAFSGRLGKIIEVWRHASAHEPEREHALRLATAAANAAVQLDTKTLTIMRPTEVVFALDGIAKGWIVDRAFTTARESPGISGVLVDIGGDIRVGGASPNNEGWPIGIPDPRLPFDNAPLVSTARLTEHAIATSGQGVRDRIVAGTRYSPTLSPFDGWPVAHHVSASLIATNAADADALATAMLVLPEDRALALATEYNTSAHITTRTLELQVAQVAQNNAASQFFASTARDTASEQRGPADWQAGWQALATFTAPRRQLLRDPQFRSPYMAMWITDADNRPIRTLLLVGKRADWQKDNFIWWSINRATTERLVATRSMSTSGAGVYNVFWDGVDDAGRAVPAGTYVLHVETSRERGQHTYRSLTLDFGKFKRFVEVLPPTEEGGGLRVGFDHY